MESKVEHYVTLFDHKFLPQGVALYESLIEHDPDSTLWVLAMDDLAVEQLKSMNLDRMKLLNFSEHMTDSLRDAKSNRSRSEFMWTLASHSFSIIFDQNSDVNRLTYLDADVYFFKSPQLLIQDLKKSGKDILITEHAFDPKDDRTEECGRFCVQFLTVQKTDKSMEVIREWQGQCIESCASSDGSGQVFGDQKYLDEWPSKYGDRVHILSCRKETLAPWNVNYYFKEGFFEPVLFHFHSFRIISSYCMLLVISFRVDQALGNIYEQYVRHLERVMGRMRAANISVPIIPYPREFLWPLLFLKRVILKENVIRFFSLKN